MRAQFDNKNPRTPRRTTTKMPQRTSGQHSATTMAEGGRSSSVYPGTTLGALVAYMLATKNSVCSPSAATLPIRKGLVCSVVVLLKYGEQIGTKIHPPQDPPAAQGRKLEPALSAVEHVGGADGHIQHKEPGHGVLRQYQALVAVGGPAPPAPRLVHIGTIQRVAAAVAKVALAELVEHQPKHSQTDDHRAYKAGVGEGKG